MHRSVSPDSEDKETAMHIISTELLPAFYQADLKASLSL